MKLFFAILVLVSLSNFAMAQSTCCGSDATATSDSHLGEGRMDTSGAGANPPCPCSEYQPADKPPRGVVARAQGTGSDADKPAEGSDSTR